MSAIPGKLLPIVRRATPLYSKVVAAQRAQVIQRQLSAVSDLVKVTDFPVHLVAANQVLLRFVEYPSSFPLNYAGVMSVPPDIQAKGVGGYSRDNRFTGARPDGSLGLNGSYWGLPDGVAAEDLYYSCLKDWDGCGPKRLLAHTMPMVVQWQKGLLGYGVDAEIPQQLVFSGNCCTDVVVARTIRSIISVNLNLGDPVVQQALDSAVSRWRALLDSLQYNSIQEGIADPLFPDFARAIARGGGGEVRPRRDLGAVRARRGSQRTGGPRHVQGDQPGACRRWTGDANRSTRGLGRDPGSLGCDRRPRQRRTHPWQGGALR